MPPKRITHIFNSTDKLRLSSVMRLTLFCVLSITGVFALALSQDSPDTVSDTGDSTQTTARPVIYLLDLEGAIGAVTAKRIEEAIEKAEENDAEALVIMLDTPGGLIASTWIIDKAILNSHVPVIVYIAPAGARAGSAGVFITYASHIAAMAPGTNIGAAHPVGSGGKDIDSTMNEKVTNDAVASIRAMADKRGRNAEWAEKAVRESVSITATEADSLNVINYLANNIEELLAIIDADSVETPAGTKILNTKNARVVEQEESFIESVLRIITSPDIAFLLFSIGGLGIILELYHPGAILPGVIGGISLILAFYAFQTLPINTAGLLLIIFSLILFIAETQIASYGLLTIGGVISLALGGLMLIDSYDPALQVSSTVVYSVALGIGAVMLLVGFLVARTYKRKVSTGQEGMSGMTGIVRKRLEPEGMALVAGELWKAVSETGDPIEVGQPIIVTRSESIHLVVRKV